jgi:hypothetical protein
MKQTNKLRIIKAMYLCEISDTQHVHCDVVEHKSNVSYGTVTT